MVVELIKNVYWNVDNIHEIDNMALCKKYTLKSVKFYQPLLIKIDLHIYRYIYYILCIIKLHPVTLIVLIVCALYFFFIY